MKKQWEKTIALVLALLGAVSCNTPSPTEPVLGQVKPLNTGDVEGALAYWADDATVKLVGVPPGVPDSYKGKEQVRAWFKEMVTSHFQIQLEVQKTEGDTVTTKTLSWQEMTRQMNIAPLIATEVYIVKNGKIASLTWTISPESLAKVQAAMAKTPPQPMTVTFSGGKCTYDGPNRVPVGKITINLGVKSQGTVSYGLFIATLDKGKTIDDLRTVPAFPQPEWVHQVDKVEFSSDHTMVTELKVGPIYLVCFDLSGPWTKIGVFGPIEVGR